LGMNLPEPGAYGVAMCFLPVEKHSRLQCEPRKRDSPCSAGATRR
jgi:hypothetical protein